MPSDTLDIDERFKVLRIAQQEYRRANRSERGRILDHLQLLTGLHRKSLIRGYVGYGLLDTVAQVQLLNAIYDKLWLYHNFFQPVLRLEDKTLTPDGQRLRRRFSPARTPFARLCAGGGNPDPGRGGAPRTRDPAPGHQPSRAPARVVRAAPGTVAFAQRHARMQRGCVRYAV